MLTPQEVSIIAEVMMRAPMSKAEGYAIGILMLKLYDMVKPPEVEPEVEVPHANV